jgi:hypothetical protein
MASLASVSVETRERGVKIALVLVEAVEAPAWSPGDFRRQLLTRGQSDMCPNSLSDLLCRYVTIGKMVLVAAAS